MQKTSRTVLHRLVISIILITLLAVACANGDSNKGTSTTFEQLFSNPNQYNGKEITIEGFIFLGFETMVLCDELKNSGYYEGHLIPGAKIVWFEGGIPTDIYKQLQEQNMPGDYNGKAETERFGMLRVKGIFRYDGQFGHLGAFKYQINPSEINILPWNN